MAKTKIIATLGPSTFDRETIKNMVLSGVDIFRFNFSFTNHDTFREYHSLIRELEKELGRPIGIMSDLHGPKVRVKDLNPSPMNVSKGETVYFTTTSTTGFDRYIVVDFKEFINDVETGHLILIDDGKIKFQIVKKSKNYLEAVCLVGGEIKSGKGVNVPGALKSLPIMTGKDESDLLVSLEQGVDFVALSFVRTASDVRKVKNFIHEHLQEGQESPWIISKIECKAALDNLPEIMQESDGVIVARGDLGVEISLPLVPLAQKRIIRLAKEYSKPVITATQILESMVTHETPTRAEVSDIANAIFDGSDALLVTEETSIGKFPVKVVEVLEEVASTVEKALPPFESISFKRSPIARSVSRAAVESAVELGAKSIIVFTKSGFTAKFISKLRPKMPVLAITPSIEVARKMLVLFGVDYHVTDKKIERVENIFELAEEIGRSRKILESGDLYVTVAGYPLWIKGRTNLMKVSIVE